MSGHANSVKFDDFPKLEINNEDVYGSWKKWLVEFQLCIEMTTLNLGTEEVTVRVVRRRKITEHVNVFRGRRKLLVLLHAIGENGREVLQALGFDMDDVSSTFEQALELLKSYYNVEESIYVKTKRFVTIIQGTDENEKEYLLRVEKLSRTLNFGNNDNVRQEFAVAIAVLGLRNSSYRLELMQITDMTWDKMTNVLGSKQLAVESANVIDRCKPSSIKMHYMYSSSDVSNISSPESRCHGSNTVPSRTSSSDSFTPEWRRKDSKNVSSNVSSSYETSRRDNSCFCCKSVLHKIRFCPYAICKICKSVGHTKMDCRCKDATDHCMGNSKEIENCISVVNAVTQKPKISLHDMHADVDNAQILETSKCRPRSVRSVRDTPKELSSTMLSSPPCEAMLSNSHVSEILMSTERGRNRIYYIRDLT